jgi:Uma2 family endonuclease
MGTLTSIEAVALRWAQICNAPHLRDLPYKIELNAFGNIEMSPASNRHARLQSKIAQQLARGLVGGDTLTECSIATDIGVRVPDVVWASDEFLRQYGDATPFPRAPEICVEIRSPSNDPEEMKLKTRAYLDAGATEVWVVTEDAQLSFFDKQGPIERSRYPVTLTLPPRAARRDSN